jgi:DNA repair exonuclease SbcCD ATPase subunit
MKCFLSQVAAACVLSVAAVPLALAQSAPPPKSQAKPPSIVVPQSAPKPAASKTLGGKAVSGKLLTRDELRTCMKRLADVNTASKDMQARRTALDGEKDDLAKSGEALKTERADVEARLAAVREWEGRMKGYGAEITAFNQRMAVAGDPKLAASEREAQAKALEAERERLNQAREPLTAEEARVVPAYQTAVAAYNTKAGARDALVSDWNARNKALNDQSLKQEGERTAWLLECADRPYREDDEIAIKAGK